MKLTAIIRDESPLQIEEPCAVRRVTVEQAKSLALRGSYEAYRTVFLEPDAPAEAANG